MYIPRLNKESHFAFWDSVEMTMESITVINWTLISQMIYTF